MKPIVVLGGCTDHFVLRFLVALVFLSLAVRPVDAADPVRIGGHSSVTEVALEADETSGHLLAVLRYETAIEDCFTVNFSSDMGVTWAQPYQSCSSHGYGEHLGAAIVDGYLYVAYVAKMAVHSVRVVRVRTSDGAYDSSYGSETVFSAAVGESICHLALASNHASFDDRVYLFALTEGNLKFFWTDEDGGQGVEAWNDVATGVSDASCWMLEATYNDGYWLGTGFNPIVAYQAGWDLYLWRYHGTTGADHFLFDADAPVFERPGSVAASHDELEAVYWSYSYETKACESSSAGSSPVCRSWGACDSDFAGDMVASPGGGFGAVYAPDNGACLMRLRDEFGHWTGSAVCNDSRPSLRGPLAVAPVPPFSSVSYGLVAVDDDPLAATPYFILAPVIFFNGFEAGDSSGWTSEVP